MSVKAGQAHGVRPVPRPDPAAGAGDGDGDRVCPVAVGPADPSRTVEDLLCGWWALLQALGAVPRVLVWDGEAAIGRWRRGRSELTAATQAFRGTLATKVVICRPADPLLSG